MTKTEIAERFDALCAAAAGAAAYLIFLGSVASCLGVWGWQLLTYLKAGAWRSFSVIDMALFLHGDAAPPWLMWPQQWIGFHKILAVLPGATVVLIVGVITGAVLLGFAQSLKK